MVFVSMLAKSWKYLRSAGFVTCIARQLVRLASLIIWEFPIIGDPNIVA